MNPVSETPLHWIETEAQLNMAISNLDKELKEVPILGVDLEYYDADHSLIRKSTNLQ